MPNPVHVADTVPYPWPYNGELAVGQLALLICGAQRRLFELSMSSPEVSVRLVGLADFVRGNGGRVIWIRHGDAGRPGRPLQLLPAIGSDGWMLACATDPSDLVIDSAGWDGCFGSTLDHRLRTGGTRTVVLGGFASEVTVDSTVRTLNDQGHECLVLSDGCAPIDLHLGARAQHSLTMSGGIFGALGTTSALFEALQRSLSQTSTTNSSPTREEIPA